MSHFSDRCLERGIVKTDPMILQDELQSAVRNYDRDPRMSEYVELVKEIDRGLQIWRFLCADGIGFVLMDRNGNCVTLLTADMVKTYKAISRGRARDRKDLAAQRMAQGFHNNARQKRARLGRSP